jgi:hypothetical protein
VANVGVHRQLSPSVFVNSLCSGPVADESVRDVNVTLLYGMHQRSLSIVINSIHVGRVRACEGVHGVNVAFHSGKHQRT